MMLTLAADWNEPADTWVVPGFICGSRTLLSGEPKAGKSTLAGHLAASLIHQTPFLGQKPKEGFHKVIWMGFDASWQKEIQSRFPSLSNFVYFAKSLDYRQEADWKELGAQAVNLGATLIIVDHLYGVSRELDLDRSHEMRRALNPLMDFQERTKIPLLLIAHAGKSGTGRAAHSVLLEAEFRHLVRITATKKNRTLHLSGNYIGQEALTIKMDPSGIELIERDEDRAERIRRNRTDIALHQAKGFLREAPSEFRVSAKKAGEWFANSGQSKNAEAGRTLANKLIEQELLSKPMGPGHPIKAGPKLVF